MTGAVRKSQASGAGYRLTGTAGQAQRVLGATVLWTREDIPVSLLDAFLEQWQIGRDGRRRGIVEVQR